jgi:hypothetical protein
VLNRSPASIIRSGGRGCRCSERGLEWKERRRGEVPSPEETGEPTVSRGREERSRGIGLRARVHPVAAPKERERSACGHAGLPIRNARISSHRGHVADDYLARVLHRSAFSQSGVTAACPPWDIGVSSARLLRMTPSPRATCRYAARRRYGCGWHPRCAAATAAARRFPAGGRTRCAPPGTERGGRRLSWAPRGATPV